MGNEIREITLYRKVQIFFLLFITFLYRDVFGSVSTYCALRNDCDVVYLFDNKEKKMPERINSLLNRSPVQVVNKIYLQKIGDIYTLYITFSEKFSPRIHTMPNRLNILFSFTKPISVPLVGENFKHRLVSDLKFKKIGERSLFMDINFSTNVALISKKYSEKTLWISFKLIEKKRIMIDAGHGGSDPGAHGFGGEFEKNITLRFAKELRNILEDTGRYSVIMTRQEDKFYSVEDRVANVIRSKADVLISIHTDSNPVTQLHGMSVYTLPTLLKDREITPEYLENLYKSRNLAKKIIGYIPKSCKIKKHPCRSTELKILKVTIPAVLIEVGCLSNKLDYALLHLKEFRDRMNCAILYALDDFFKQGSR